MLTVLAKFNRENLTMSRIVGRDTTVVFSAVTGMYPNFGFVKY